MSVTAVVLILISAVSHASWNLLGKKDNPSISFFLLTNFCGIILFSPFILLHLEQVQMLPARLWFFLVMSGFCQAVYFSGLAGAYRFGDMSVAYPLARSSPVIVVAIVTLALGRGNQISPQSILGILLVVSGCFLVPLLRFSHFRIGNYLNPTCILALIAAFGTAGYSIIDDEALRLLRNLESIPLGNTVRTILYGSLQGCFILAWLCLFVLVSPSERKRFRVVLNAGVIKPAITGVLMFSTYAMVLISMAFVRNVSYVVAFRQVSILVGTVFGVIFLKEKLHPPRLVGVIIIFIGLILVGTG